MRPSNRATEAPADRPSAPLGTGVRRPDDGERLLVERARGGDEEAFRMLVEHHRDHAYGLALKILRAPGEAEEVAQDAFVRVWRALPRFRGEAAFSTWLYRIVARCAFDRAALLRTRRAREADLESAGDLPDPAGAQVDAEARGRARRIERLLASLPEAQRNVVTLYYYHDRSVEETAAILGVPENTVKTHLSRARAALRAAWMREEGGA